MIGICHASAYPYPLHTQRRILWHHVRAHTGGSDWQSRWNDEADAEAKRAAGGV